MAVRSSVTGKAWLGGQLNQQAWLDASKPAAQDYVIAMTKEVLALGFDEVQYDYVRFPSDPAPKEPGDPVFGCYNPCPSSCEVEVLPSPLGPQFLRKRCLCHVGS